VKYALFTNFFPHLISGPILHHQEVASQFAGEERYELNSDDRTVELSWRILELAKETILANTLAIIADPRFRHLPPSQ
jgi:alginate O-acetyltransferase complex protein AlgI